jgi:hypothetical protein
MAKRKRVRAIPSTSGLARRKRAVALALASGGVLGSIGFLSPVPAGASDGPLYYSFIDRSLACTVNWQGTALNQNDFNLYMDNYTGGLHVNSVMWAHTHTGSQCPHYWFEAGVRNGSIPADALATSSGGQCPSGQASCIAYARYVDQYWGTSSHGYLWAYAKTPNSTNHVYEFLRTDIRTGNSSDANYWDVYIDFQLVAVAKNQGSNRIYNELVGGEAVAGLNNLGSAHAPTFTMGALQGYSGGHWNNIQTWEYAQVDRGCNITPQPCMNGTHPGGSSYQWAWNIENP